MKVRYLILIIFILILGFEIFLRLFISKPSTQQFDNELGYTNIPNSQMIESMEGYSFVKFNKLGFNDLDPDADIKRKIFIIGDSYTEAFQVDRKFDYVSLIEDSLKIRSVDVIKLARDSFIPLHYPVVSSRFYDQYNPELTILQLGSHTLSDLFDENVTVKYSESGKIEEYSMSVSDGDKNKETLRIIINNSALAYYIMRRYKYLIKNVLTSINDLVSLFDKNIPAVSKENKKTEKEYKERLVYILERMKGNLVVVYIPDPQAVLGEAKKNNNIKNIISAASKDTNISFIDLTKYFVDSYSENNRMLNGFVNSKPNKGHLNKEGHRLVAKSILLELKNIDELYK